MRPSRPGLADLVQDAGAAGRVPADEQQALLGLLRRLLDALVATSAAEGRPLNLDTEAFRTA